MSILAWIVIGGLAGWIASMIMKNDGSLLMDIILGVVGAIVGGAIMSFFGQPGISGINLYSLLIAVVGSSLLIWIGRVVTKTGPGHHRASYS